MSEPIHTIDRKAFLINENKGVYGVFAEIGAGQEVARHFFQAGLASQTVAKTMSAYDMTFSDKIYGSSDRYVSRSRLESMLDHEYSLLEERLGPKRGHDTCFFSFANTVTTSSKASAYCHGWVGVRFQLRPKGPVNEILLHTHMHNHSRLQQQNYLGYLGVNLIHSAYHQNQSLSLFLKSLMDHIDEKAMNLDFIHISGDDFTHFDNREAMIELIRQGFCQAVLFDDTGRPRHAGSSFYKKSFLIQRGTFRPITNANLNILSNAINHLKQIEFKPEVLAEIQLNHEFSNTDYIQRVDTLSALGLPSMFTNFKHFYEIKDFLRKFTEEPLFLVVGALDLENLFNPDNYTNLSGGLLQAFGLLFDQSTSILVYPFKSDELCSTTQSFKPGTKLYPFYDYLVKNQKIIDISNCDDISTSIHSVEVRKMLENSNSEWKKLVPEPVVKMIEENNFFK